MAAELTANVSSVFEKEVGQLLKRWIPIKEGYAKLAKQHLDFAKLIVELWEKAKVLDRQTGGSLHKDHMRQQLQELVQTDDQSILSRWRTIGTQAEVLLPVAEHLPADRDHLYQLATAAKQAKPIAEWVEQKKIHPTVSVNEIKSLKIEGVRRKPIAKATRTQSVTFNFSLDVEAKEIVETLRSAFESAAFESVIADNRVIAECQDSLRQIFEKLKPKFINATPPKPKAAKRKAKRRSPG